MLSTESDDLTSLQAAIWNTRGIQKVISVYYRPLMWEWGRARACEIASHDSLPYKPSNSWLTSLCSCLYRVSLCPRIDWLIIYRLFLCTLTHYIILLCFMYLLASITILTLYFVLLILYLYWLFHILDCTGFMEIKMMITTPGLQSNVKEQRNCMTMVENVRKLVNKCSHW
jgi:hypothetical protein